MRLLEPSLLVLLELSYGLKELHPIQRLSELFCLNEQLLLRYLLFLNQVLGTHPS
jgi:hypothetical protein